MKIKIICVGKLKEQYLKDACAEYKKRLTRFCEVEITELSEYRLPDTPSAAQLEKAVHEESSLILCAAAKADYVIALDVSGKQFSSEELSRHISDKLTDGVNSIAFIIGGSCGYDDRVRKLAHLRLSFSKLTFPHQLFRVMLLEQVYRAFKINAGEKYHK